MLCLWRMHERNNTKEGAEAYFRCFVYGECIKRNNTKEGAGAYFQCFVYGECMKGIIQKRERRHISDALL